MTLYLPVGPPGCGKTALAQDLMSDQRSIRPSRLLAPDAVISTDRIRTVMTGTPTDQSANAEAWDVARKMAHARLERGLTVYFDATNLNPDWYDKMLAKAKDNDHRVLFMLFDTTYDVCRARNLARGSLAIPDTAVERMIDLHKAITPDQLDGDVITINGADANKTYIPGIVAWVDGLPPPETT